MSFGRSRDLPAQTVFVTGCATGFGRGLAEALLAGGHRVVATDPDVGALAPLSGDRCLVLPLDVRDEVSVADAVTRALAWGAPDALVNNAGYALFGTQEEVPIDLARDLFDVNVLGVGRVTRALLPTLRERRGVVVQLSSVAGRTAFPESGWYAATKHAIEGLTESLFQEVGGFGVRVRLIQPGSYDTCFLPTALACSPPRDPASPYAARRTDWDARKAEALEPPQPRDAVVQAILTALVDPRPFYRQPVGPDAVRMLALRDALGADAWVIFQAQRNGVQVPTPPGGVLTAAQVLAGDGDADPLSQAVTGLAFAAGQLEHWRRDEASQAAYTVVAGWHGR